MELLKQEFKRLELKVNDIRSTLNDVHAAIIGNPLSKDGGMAGRLTDAEKDLERLKGRIEGAEKTLTDRIEVAEKKQIKSNVLVIVMWSCVSGAAAIFFAYIIQVYFSHHH